jgi:hypothetical protein
VSIVEGATAGCAIGTAWAGPAGTVLPVLRDCRLPPAFDVDLRAGDLVYTDVCGQAVLNSRCGTIYVFQDSRLRVSSCAPGGSQAVDCLDYGAFGMDNTCHTEPVQFITPNSSFSLEGTWVGVIYVPDRQVTVFVVLDGTARAVALDPAGAPIGDRAIVRAAEFWFTSSRENEQVGGLDGRVTHPIDALPAVARDLQIETWLASLFERAAGHVDTSAVPLMPVVNIRARGGAFDDPRVQEALLWAMDWKSAAQSLFPEGEGRIVGLIPSGQGNHPHDLAEWGIDFERAFSLLDEAGRPDVEVIPVVADANDVVVEVAKAWMGYLYELQLPVQLFVEEPGVADAHYADFGSKGDPIIWLSSH